MSNLIRDEDDFDGNDEMEYFLDRIHIKLFDLEERKDVDWDELAERVLNTLIQYENELGG